MFIPRTDDSVLALGTLHQPMALATGLGNLGSGHGRPCHPREAWPLDEELVGRGVYICVQGLRCRQ